MAKPLEYNATLTERIDVTDALTLFRVTPDKPPEERTWFVPGQYCVLGMNNAEKPELHFFDRAAEREQAAIDAAFPGATNRFVSFDRDAKLAIVRTSGDTSPPDYYRYDRDRRRMDFLFTENPGLDRTQLSPMKPVRYAARDGTPISAYLTVPHSAAAKNLPVIVIVHDGPSGRVTACTS